MNVIDLLAYRVIPLDKSDGINVGSVLPIPEERAVFDGNQKKNETEDFFEEIRKDYTCLTGGLRKIYQINMKIRVYRQLIIDI